MFEELPRDLANPAGLKGRTLLGQAVNLSASVHQLGISSEVPRVPSVTVSVLTLIQTCLLQSNSNPAQQHDEKKKALEKAYSKATLLRRQRRCYDTGRASRGRASEERRASTRMAAIPQ